MNSDLDLEVAEALSICTMAVGSLEHLSTPKFRVVGSTYIMNRRGMDIDVICYADGYVPFEQIPGFVCQDHNPDYPEDEMVSYRYSDINLLMVTTKEYFNLWIRSAEVCKFLQAEDKDLRVKIHRIIMDGELA